MLPTSCLKTYAAHAQLQAPPPETQLSKMPHLSAPLTEGTWPAGRRLLLAAQGKALGTCAPQQQCPVKERTPASSLRHSHPARSRPNSNRCSQDLCRRNKRVHRRSKAGEDATSQLIHGTGPRHDQCSGPGTVGSRGAARGPAPAGAVPAVETRQTPAEGQQK